MMTALRPVGEHAARHGRLLRRRCRRRRRDHRARPTTHARAATRRTELGRRLARNTQSVLRDGVPPRRGSSTRPAARGTSSGFTDQLADAAWACFQEIEARRRVPRRRRSGRHRRAIAATPGGPPSADVDTAAPRSPGSPSSPTSTSRPRRRRPPAPATDRLPRTAWGERSRRCAPRRRRPRRRRPPAVFLATHRHGGRRTRPALTFAKNLFEVAGLDDAGPVTDDPTTIAARSARRRHRRLPVLRATRSYAEHGGRGRRRAARRRRRARLHRRPAAATWPTPRRRRRRAAVHVGGDVRATLADCSTSWRCHEHPDCRPTSPAVPLGSAPRRVGDPRRRRSAASRGRRPRASTSAALYTAADLDGLDFLAHLPGHRPVPARPVPDDVRQPAVDDPPVRRLLHRRGVQRLLPPQPRRRPEGPVGRLRPGDPPRLRQRPPACRRRRRHGRRGDRLDPRHAPAVRRHPARPR